MTVGSREERNAELVIEVEVSDLGRSLDFYRQVGFTPMRVEGSFASLRWRTAWLFLTVGPRSAANAATGTNLRVIVDDVDALWTLAKAMGAIVEAPIGDRGYGLRDFTIRDPDGFALRFAKPADG